MKRKYLWLGLLAAFICFSVFTVYKCFQNNRWSSTLSTISAIDATLSSELNKGNAAIKKVFQPINQDWRFLTAEEYDRVIFELAKTHNLDVPKGWNPGSPLLDFWGNRLVIRYRKLPNKEHYDIEVISKGPDGIFQTKDDVSRGQYK